MIKAFLLGLEALFIEMKCAERWQLRDLRSPQLAHGLRLAQEELLAAGSQSLNTDPKGPGNVNESWQFMHAGRQLQNVT